MKKLIVSMIVFSSVILADGARGAGIKPVDNQLYINECASCHFAYQPGLLPERSWRKLMSNLENHFGDDATLDKEDSQTLLNYLVENSADKAQQFKRSRKIYKSISAAETPIAISQTRYFKHEHKGIPKRVIRQKEVRSLSNCMACHTTADKGIYGERAIKIPNYGRWNDD